MWLDVFNGQHIKRLDDFRKRIVPNENVTSVDLRWLSIVYSPPPPASWFDHLHIFFSVEDVMQFYNYATRVLLDDLSNIIRCFFQLWLQSLLAPNSRTNLSHNIISATQGNSHIGSLIKSGQVFKWKQHMAPPNLLQEHASSNWEHRGGDVAGAQILR